MKRLLLAGLLVGAWVATAAQAAPVAHTVGLDRMVFGSFQNSANAQNWALRVSQLLQVPVTVEPLARADRTWYRVTSKPLDVAAFADLQRRAVANRLRHWRLVSDATIAEPGVRPNPQAPVRLRPPAGRIVEGAPGLAHDARESPAGATQAPGHSQAPPRHSQQSPRHSQQSPQRSQQQRSQPRAIDQQLDLDIGAQARTYADTGFAGQSRLQPSLSARLDYYRSWDQGRHSMTVSPFLRWDAEDPKRTHFDLRELYWSRVGNDWDLHVGVKQVFWGVTEFKHLVDVVNQTDLVENIDGEDKLGQPMVHLSLVRDWGILDFMLLTGFRERTFPGRDGRLRFSVPVAHDATYESGAEQLRTDAVVRWSHASGPLEWGLYHFSGTSREPQMRPELSATGELRLRPHYPLIEQTGLDAQAILGDWAVKFEAISNSGFDDRYTAFNAGLERTLVGVFGGRADLGIVAEYLFDDRDEAAFDTLFEHDLALGTRWSLNDAADTTALLGLIVDVETSEYVFSIEGSRRLGNTWTLLLEGRIFGGATDPDPNALLESLFDADNKSASLQRDDFIQLELTRYF